MLLRLAWQLILPLVGDKEISFIRKTPGVNVIKLFSFIVDNETNKLVCLYVAITFQSSQTFAGNTRSLPKKEASERGSIGLALALL
jgi:hypothetical protein